MQKYVIDGKFLTEQITGVQRYALEITKELDQISQDINVEILVPENSKIEAMQYNNLNLVKYGRHTGNRWEQLDFPKYLRKRDATGIYLCNVVPVLYPKGIVCVHDVSYKVNPQFFTGFHGKVSRLWHMLQYSIIMKNAKKIVTVSEFSKKEIIRYYNISEEKIVVIGCAWQHFKKMPDEKEFDAFPMLEKGKYYFSMASVAPNKNLKWILEAAKKNPQSVFAISGMLNKKKFGSDLDVKNLDNVYYLGRISDAQAKILMKHCKAFLFPTLYEGFGLPPLEAVACGAPEIIVSDTAVMHEIYGEFARYINPVDYNIDLNKLEQKEEITNHGLLDKYSWANNARMFKKLLE